MSSTGTDLVPVIVTGVFALVAGSSVGSFISTYGGKARERRIARSACIFALRSIETERRTHMVTGRIVDKPGLAELEAKCMAAGVPRFLSALYRSASERFEGQKVPLANQGAADVLKLSAYVVADNSIERAAELLISSLWHPWLSRLLRRRRLRELEKIVRHVSGRGTYLLSVQDSYRIWRRLAGETTWRDRVGGRSRRAFRMTDPVARLMERSSSTFPEGSAEHIILTVSSHPSKASR
jgi:hypothetical protein